VGDLGEVDREIVIQVLQANGVRVSPQENGEAGMMVLAKDEKVEARRIPSKVGRRTLQYFQRHYGVPIYQFYNPLMAPPPPGEQIQ